MTMAVAGLDADPGELVTARLREGKALPLASHIIWNGPDQG
jgi:hypothetical protein